MDDSRAKRLETTLIEARSALRECSDLAFELQDELMAKDERKWVLRSAHRDVQRMRELLQGIQVDVAGMP